MTAVISIHEAAVLKANVGVLWTALRPFIKHLHYLWSTLTTDHHEEISCPQSLDKQFQKRSKIIFVQPNFK